MPSRAIVLAVANQKGGVAKTTTVASLGAAWVELGHRVLMVDLDPQACLTFSLGYDPEDVDPSVHQVLLSEGKANEAIVGTDDGPDLLPATIELATAEQLLVMRTGREQLLKVALKPVLPAYDFVLLDCPPTLGILTTMALTAAPQVLIPLQCETLSHRGVGQLLDTVHDVKVAVLEPPIPRSVRFAEAPAGRTLVTSARAGKGAVAYRTVAAALASRLQPS